MARITASRLAGTLPALLIAWLCAGAAAAQTSTPPQTPPQTPPKKPAGQQPGPGKVLGLPAPKGDKARREGRLVLPAGLRKKPRQESTTPVTAPAYGDGALADFAASLLSDKELTTAELVAEYSLLADSERQALLQRAHRLAAKALGRLARVYRNIPEPRGVPPLLTVLRSRKIGKHTREVVEHALFLSGERAKLVGLDLLASKYKAVREAAGNLLVRILDEGDVPQLRLLIDHDEQSTRLMALRVLAEWLKDSPGSDTSVLLRCLRHRDGSVRAQAARYLRDRGDQVTGGLLPLVADVPEDSSFFLAALLLARRELVKGEDLLPGSALSHLARHRFGVEPMPRSVAFIVAAMRTFRDPVRFGKEGGALASVTTGELIGELLKIVEVTGFYSEFPVCHDAALLCLRLLSGEDFAADHHRWSAWWDGAKSGGFVPLRRSVALDASNAARARLAYRAGGELRFVVLGAEAREPAGEDGARVRLTAERLLALDATLRELGLLDVGARLREVGGFTEGHSLLVVTPEARARDGFVGETSPRLRMFLNVFEKTLEREAWQEFVPPGLDAEGRRAWWAAERANLEVDDPNVRRVRTLDLALRVLPDLGEKARRHSLGLFLEEAAAREPRLTKKHAGALIALVGDGKLAKDEVRSVFEVLARIEAAPFGATLSALAERDGPEVPEILRRMLAVAGAERVLLALRHESPRIRAGTAGEIGNLGHAEAIGPLVACLDDPDFEVRMRAAESCGRLRLAKARPKIVQLLGDERGVVRQAAMLALARIGGADTYQILLRLTGPGTPAERLTAVKALTMLADNRSGFALVEIAAAHFDLPVGMMAMQGLRRRGGSALRAKVWKVLQASDNPRLRRELTFLLGEMGDPGVFDPLLRLLEAGDSPQRCCRLLAGICGIDWCGHRDRVKRYRQWLIGKAGQSPASWFLAALAGAEIDTSLSPADLVPGAPERVIDEVCRIIDTSKKKDWPVRALAANVLRDITQQDFGSVHERTHVGLRRAITERYRQFARERDASRGR